MERGVERAVAERIFEQVRGFSGLRLPEGARGRVRPARLPVDVAARALRPGVPVRAAERAADGLLSPGRARARGAAARDGRCCPRTSTAATSSAGSRTMAVRIGLGYVQGVKEEEVKALVAERERGGPYRDAGDLAARSGAGRDTLERLAWAGPATTCRGARRCGRWASSRRAARCRAACSCRCRCRRPRRPALRALTAWERLLADYGSFRISIAEHPMALLRPDLPQAVTVEPRARAHSRPAAA